MPGFLNKEVVPSFPIGRIRLLEDRVTTLESISGALTTLAATGTINDTNVTFTFTSEPLLVVINGIAYRSSGGAITWSYLAGTVTLSQPVGTGGDIYGLS